MDVKHHLVEYILKKYIFRSCLIIIGNNVEHEIVSTIYQFLNQNKPEFYNSLMNENIEDLQKQERSFRNGGKIVISFRKTFLSLLRELRNYSWIKQEPEPIIDEPPANIESELQRTSDEETESEHYSWIKQEPEPIIDEPPANIESELQRTSDEKIEREPNFGYLAIVKDKNQVNKFTLGSFTRIVTVKNCKLNFEEKLKEKIHELHLNTVYISKEPAIKLKSPKIKQFYILKKENLCTKCKRNDCTTGKVSKYFLKYHKILFKDCDGLKKKK